MVKSWDCCIDLLTMKDNRAEELYEFKMVQHFNKERKDKYLASFILGLQIILFIIWFIFFKS